MREDDPTAPRHFRFSLFSGVTLYADVWNADAKRTVFLLHGGGQTRGSWSEAAEALASTNYRVVSYDARGHGESDWATNAPYDLPHLADDFMHLRSRFPGPAVAIGASMGGMTAFYAAGACDMEPLNGVVLADIALKPASAGVRRIIEFMNAHQDGFAAIADAQQAINAYRGTSTGDRRGANLSKNLRKHRDGRFYWHWDPRIMDMSAEAFHHALIAVSRNVRIPVLLVRGGNSDVVTDDGVEELRKLVPQAQTATASEQGHMVTGDNNLAFLSQALPFVKSAFSDLRESSGRVS